MQAVLAAVPQQGLKTRGVGGGGDDQDVLDARQHEGGQRVVDHGLVVDRQQLLGGHERERIQAGAGPAGEDDAFHDELSSAIEIEITQAINKTLKSYFAKPYQY